MTQSEKKKRGMEKLGKSDPQWLYRRSGDYVNLEASCSQAVRRQDNGMAFSQIPLLLLNSLNILSIFSQLSQFSLNSVIPLIFLSALNSFPDLLLDHLQGFP